MEQQQQHQLLHFCDSKHPLVFDPDNRDGETCCGCQESIYGPTYYCPQGGCPYYWHHKSCAELPLGLHHPLHPIHPLILSPEWIEYGEDIQFSNCELCKEDKGVYTYRCFRCNFNLHITCASLAPTTMEPDFHHHPLIPVRKWITFTCDLCGKKDEGTPYLCHLCDFWVHRRCAYKFPRIVKVVRHKHLLHLTHSSLEFHQSDFRICLLCVRKVDTRYGLYYCSKCDFVAHLDCAIFKGNKENINLQKFKDEDEVSEQDKLVHSATYKVPLGLHHPLHPIHPLILFSPERWAFYGDDIQIYKCEICKEYRSRYTYRCFRCDFNLHITCASLPPTWEAEAELHDHPLTLVWKWFTFTCDFCGKEDKGMPFLCNTCAIWIHRTCAYQYPRRVKVVRHKHLLHLTHSSIEFHQPDPRFCQLCVQKLDTRYGLYYCSKCNFVAHLDCAIFKENREDIDVQKFEDEDEVPELDESVDSVTYKVNKFNMGEDGTQIAIEIKHFSHEHDLMLTDEALNNQKCDGCVRDILPPFYSCVKCGFFLHESCVKLPKKKKNPLHRHPLTLLPKEPYRNKLFRCNACGQDCNGFTYNCIICKFDIDVECSLKSDIFTHEGHEHQLILSNTAHRQKCNCCDNERCQVFRCTTCEFVLDFRCATLPHTTRYGKHEHPFTLSYKAEDDSGEYYCDICEEERWDSKYWFYYCEGCSYPAHPNCIIGKYPNLKFGGAYTFDCHSHPLTFVEETKDHPQCNECNYSCEELIYQCAQCNFYIHWNCL